MVRGIKYFYRQFSGRDSENNIVETRHFEKRRLKRRARVVTSVSYSAASVAASGKIPVNAMPIQLDIQMLSAVETRLRAPMCVCAFEQMRQSQGRNYTRARILISTLIWRKNVAENRKNLIRQNDSLFLVVKNTNGVFNKLDNIRDCDLNTYGT